MFGTFCWLPVYLVMVIAIDFFGGSFPGFPVS